MSQMTAANVPAEVFSRFSSTFEDVRKVCLFWIAWHFVVNKGLCGHGGCMDGRNRAQWYAMEGWQQGKLEPRDTQLTQYTGPDLVLPQALGRDQKERHDDADLAADQAWQACRL